MVGDKRLVLKTNILNGLFIVPPSLRRHIINQNRYAIASVLANKKRKLMEQWFVLEPDVEAKYYASYLEKRELAKQLRIWCVRNGIHSRNYFIERIDFSRYEERGEIFLGQGHTGFEAIGFLHVEDAVLFIFTYSNEFYACKNGSCLEYMVRFEKEWKALFADCVQKDTFSELIQY